MERDKPMAPVLREFLDGRTPACVEPLHFGAHRMQLRAYLTRDLPPPEFVLAARAVVRLGGEVLVARNRNGQHVLPGGRIEAGESPEQAARRELLEETGWEIGSLERLAVAHVYYETPEPTDVGRVIYPDFLWQVFSAVGIAHRPERKLLDDHEEGAVLKPLQTAERVVSLGLERVLLGALRPRQA